MLKHPSVDGLNPLHQDDELDILAPIAYHIAAHVYVRARQLPIAGPA